jgi:hypothetical protein
MRKVAMTLFLVLLAAQTYASSCTECDKSAEIILTVSKGIESCINRFNSSGDVNELAKMLPGIKACVAELDGLNSRLVELGYGNENYYRSKMVQATIETMGEVVADDMVKVADVYAKSDIPQNRKVAKELYRDVIIKFTGDVFKTYVKRAEFGLEDLKN